MRIMLDTNIIIYAKNFDKKFPAAFQGIFYVTQKQIFLSRVDGVQRKPGVAKIVLAGVNQIRFDEIAADEFGIGNIALLKFSYCVVRSVDGSNFQSLCGKKQAVTPVTATQFKERGTFG